MMVVCLASYVVGAHLGNLEQVWPLILWNFVCLNGGGLVEVEDCLNGSRLMFWEKLVDLMYGGLDSGLC